jgi:hypothetical protein
VSLTKTVTKAGPANFADRFCKKRASVNAKTVSKNDRASFTDPFSTKLSVGRGKNGQPNVGCGGSDVLLIVLALSEQ